MFKKNILKIIIIISLFQLTLMSETKTENIKIPGNATLLSRYINFYYNLPTKDFLYHFNDLLIFSESPTKNLIKNGVRKKIMDIILMEKRIDQLIKKKFLFEKNMFTINISKRKGLRNGIKLMNYLGLIMEKSGEGYNIESDNSTGIVDYHKFINLNIKSLEKQINKTRRIFYRHITSDIPANINFDFLNNITGFSLNKDNFLLKIVREKRLSILLGIIFRLSDSEIDYISNLKTKSIKNPWKTIYEDGKFLMGLFNLSGSLRVKNNMLNIPGGDKAVKFWSIIADADYSKEKFKFLKNITTSLDGKLNYLYSISFWQSNKKLKSLFFNFDPIKMKKILSLVKLSKNEKLTDNRFARLRKQGFFNLLYALEERDGKIYFPGNIKNWIRILNKKKLTKKIKNIDDANKLTFLFIKTVLEKNSYKDEFPAVKKIISIYSKFLDRPELLDENTLRLFFHGYKDYNILIDFIDKIDIKDWETAINMFNWVKKLQTKNLSDRADFSAVYQSYFEILAFVTKNHTNGNDFDRTINELLKIPLNKSTFIHDMFEWFGKNFNIPLKKNYIDNRFIEFLLQGLNNRMIDIEDEEYEFQLNNITKKSINSIINSQEVIRLSSIFEFEQLFSAILSSDINTRSRAFKNIIKLFQIIPHPEISDEAPDFIKRRVMTYSRKELNRDLKKLGIGLKKDGNEKKLQNILNRFRKKYIFPHLKNFLVTIAYAINAKSERLRMFINPNLVKLHDFRTSSNHTPWNYSGRPESSLTLKSIPGFRLKGGLSRLNLLFASVWKDQMLAGNIIFDSQLVQSLLYNVLQFYPYVNLKYFPEYISLLIEYGLELLEKAKSNKMINKLLSEKIGKLFSGYSYKKSSEYLEGKNDELLLFYNQYFKIGKSLIDCNKCLEIFSQKDRLKKYFQLPLSLEILHEKDNFGNIYYNCLGSLRPKWRDLFPPEEADIFKSGYFLGEEFNEFKMRLSYLASKKKYSTALYGHFLFNYLLSSFPRFYQQNYEKDIFTTYFIFNIMNNSNFKKILKKYKRRGYVRIR